jgi:iron complex outermembrane receptor protein
MRSRDLLTATVVFCSLTAASAAGALEPDSVGVAPQLTDAREPVVPASPPPDSGVRAPQPVDAGAPVMATYQPAVPDARPEEQSTPQESELALFQLDSAMSQSVSSATGSQTRASEAPAVITVITREEIEVRGYRSLADALRTVPGFYDVFDGVTHNVGVRGINAGLGASGSIIKLMIDGLPVDYRPTNGNFFGEELVPLQAVERIEVIRGPASALYGANAFLGVINVITRSGADVDGVRLVGDGLAYNKNPGGGGSVLVGGASGRVDLLVGARLEQIDRSGLPMPQSGSNAGMFSALAATSKDTSTPAAFFARATVDDILHGKLSLMASLQRLDAADPFFLLNPLNTTSRVSLLNQNYRAKYEVDIGSRVSLSAYGNAFLGAPNADNALDPGKPGILFIPQVGALGGGGGAEARIRIHELVSLTVGADYLHEDHLVQSYSQQLTLDQTGGNLKAGTTLLGTGAGVHHTFDNFGAFAQLLVSTRFGLSGIAGVRVDDHSVYGINPTTRVGLVYAPSQLLSFKLLYGSSFKAPSAEQLYTQPIVFGGIVGNANLQAQHANNIDADIEFRLPRDLGDLQFNAFVTNAQALVEYLPSGPYFVADNNVDEWILGGELALHLVPIAPLRCTLNAGVAKPFFRSERSAVISNVQVNEPSFPVVQAHGIVQYALPWWGLRATVEASVVGPREASLSNALLAGYTYLTNPYVYGAVALTALDREVLPGRKSTLSLRVTNVFAQTWVEPGYGGTDLPGAGITAGLTLIQAL